MWDSETTIRNMKRKKMTIQQKINKEKQEKNKENTKNNKAINKSDSFDL